MASTEVRPARSPSTRAACCSADHGVSPMVNRATTGAAASIPGSRVRTSVTRWKDSPARSASWATAVADWSSTPCTPAGPSR